MTDGYKKLNHKLTRLGRSSCLVLFLWLFVSECAFKEEKSDDKPGITLRWKAEKAVGIAIPRHLTPDLSDDSLATLLKVHLAGSESSTPMLGKYEFQDASILFKPLIPFTPGLGYDIFLNTVFMGGVVIPRPGNGEKPALLSIYPTSDTLPANLLKMYFQFSKPMRAGNSLQHISLVDEHNDTLPAPFLALQPELWNKENTRLTLWLDPGRIKKDLQPNKALGPPLVLGESITLTVHATWKDQDGLSLNQAYAKQFYVTNSDRESPIPNTWHIKTPEANTKQSLEILFGEPLDYALLQEVFTVYGAEDENIPGSISIEKGERKLVFTPDNAWENGDYIIQVEARLEDLAGNNLNRPFEVDNENYQSHGEQEIYKVEFEVK